MNFVAGKDAVPDGFTDEDLQLGKNATKFLSVLCVLAFVACVGIAMFVFANVPWDTRMPYDGKYNRSGTGVLMQIAMLPAMVPIVGFWRTARKPTTHHMGKAARSGAYVFPTAFIGASVFIQWLFAESILTAGGYFAE